jgi:GTP-binding protein
MIKMSNHGSGRVHGFQNSLARIDRPAQPAAHRHAGTALIHSIFDSWTEYAGEMALRPTGALVVDRSGPSTALALWNIQERGELFIGPAIEVYEGMIIGDNSGEQDMDVNVTKEKKQTNMRSSSADEAIRLIPHHDLSLEQAIEFIADDEFVEITPNSIRLRKQSLTGQQAPAPLAGNPRQPRSRR